MKPVIAHLHTHSAYSYDAHWPLARIARLFGAMGVEAVMMSEHDTRFDPGSFADYRAACVEASTARCQLIPGIEYSSPDNVIHILTWGLDHFLAEHRPVAETLAQVRAAGGVAVFAHPVRRDAWARFDPAWVPDLAAIEVWNRKSDGIAPGQKARDLIAQTGLPATVGCDFHRGRQIYPLTNRIEVDPALPLEAGLVEAIAAGRITPRAFGRPLGPDDGIHRRLEALRRGVLGQLRWRKGPRV